MKVSRLKDGAFSLDCEMLEFLTRKGLEARNASGFSQASLPTATGAPLVKLQACQRQVKVPPGHLMTFILKCIFGYSAFAILTPCLTE